MGKSNKIQLHNGDCLEFMKTLEDNSIDLILTDPPYGTLNFTKPKWDNVINIEEMFFQLNRIIKKDRAILLFNQEPFSTLLKYHNLKLFKYDWVWIKNKAGGFMNANLKPLKNYENISVFSHSNTRPNKNKTGNMLYNPQNLIKERKIKKIKNNKDKESIVNQQRKDIIIESKFTNYPTQVLNFNSEKNTLHPTQKPVDLLEYLIKTYSNENDIVLDFTMGSGSTGIACLNTNRSFIGCELDENYFNIAKDRIENHK